MLFAWLNLAPAADMQASELFVLRALRCLILPACLQAAPAGFTAARALTPLMPSMPSTALDPCRRACWQAI
jgi:hypothetical protein